MKPHILIYSTAYYPLVGGAEIAIKEITDRLGNQYDFDLITAKIKKGLPRVEKIGAVTVYRLGVGTFLDKLWLALRGGKFGLRLHQKNSYKMIWSMMASYGGFSASSFKAKQPTVPYLLTLQEGDELREIESKVCLIKKQFQNIFRRANYVQVISNYLASWAKRMGVIAPIRVVPNGVDLAKVESLKVHKVARQKSDEEKIIITTSRLVKKNGMTDLIQSLLFMPDEVKLWVLGVGPEEKSLREQVMRLGLTSRVVWFGFIDNTQLLPYLKEADVFVRPSLSEGLGNSFLEAMAVGLPTVGTPVGGIVDFLKPNETGWLVNVRDPKSIAEAVNFILDTLNRDKVATISDQGRQLILAKYDWKTVVIAMKEIFEKLINLPTN